MYSLRNASANVLMVGLNSAACWNCTSSFVLVVMLTAAAAVLLSSLIVHSLGPCCSRRPIKRVLPPFCMSALSFVNRHLHPALHSFPMLSRCVSPSAGERSVCVACVGSPGMFRLAVCADVMSDPSGSLTSIDSFVGVLLLHGTLSPLKCPVEPVSAIAIVLVGGLRNSSSLLLLLLTSSLARLFPSSPRHHIVVWLFVTLFLVFLR